MSRYETIRTEASAAEQENTDAITNLNRVIEGKDESIRLLNGQLVDLNKQILDMATLIRSEERRVGKSVT